jgi:hypothetical protein
MMTKMVESWKARRAMLAEQLENLESGKWRSGIDNEDVTTEDIKRLKAWIAELDGLIAEYTSSQP